LDDYLICLRKVYQYASYITVNISSPNTPGLRNLQYGEALDNLLNGLKHEQAKLTQQHGNYKPILVKIAPDLTDQEIESIAQSFITATIDGVIATNTTLDRSEVEGLQHANEAGGLSGSVLTQASQRVTEKLHKALGGKIPIVGVGGIDSATSAKGRLDGGADLIQIYSSFIYQGPTLIKKIINAL
jgi:dihydroorotate dehydrogenase